MNAVLDQIAGICFRRINLVYSIDFKLYSIRKIDELLSHQEVSTKDKKVTSIFETLKAFYLNKEHCSEFYIERNENNCQGLPNVVEDISVSSPSCQF